VEQPRHRRAAVVRPGPRTRRSGHHEGPAAASGRTRHRTKYLAAHRDPGGLIAAVGLGAYYGVAPGLGLEGADAQTLTFIAITAGQLLAVFNARTDRGSGFVKAGQNPFLWLALLIAGILEAVALGIPAVRDLLGLTTLPAEGWLYAALLAVVPLVATQTVRILRDR
jgi:Ca2+-transporting ATPase